MAANEDIVRNIKLQRGQTLARDLLLLRSFTRAFWHVAEFRRRCLPLLLVPAAAGRVVREAQRRVRPMASLAPGAMATTVRASPPGAVPPRAVITVRCAVTNRADRTLRRAAPHPVALGFRWFDAATGRAVLVSDRAQLRRPLRPGASVAIDARISAPWEPGTYELAISPVQELVAWFDDVDAANGVRVVVEVDARAQPGGCAS